MRTKLIGMLALGIGLAAWSCGAYDTRESDDAQMAGSGGVGTGGGITGGTGAGTTGGTGAGTTGGTGAGTTGGTGAGTTGGTGAGTTGGTGAGTTGGTGAGTTGGTGAGTTGGTGAGTTGGTGAGTTGGTGAGTTGGTGAGTTGGTGAGTTGGTGGETTGGAGGEITGGTGGDGTGGQTTTAEGPCDIYNGAGNECVAAYSMVRRLLSTYDGPLYQVRSGSNPQNTGTGGELHDIGQTPDGFGDAAAQDAVCAGTTCTVSLLYDQSGRGNDLPVAKRGQSAGGEYADDDDFETIADAGPLTVGGRNVYSLYMEARQGYRIARVGDGMPVGTEPQGTYMLADGTHSGTACCWDFGNVTTHPESGWDFMDTLFFGVGFWGRGEGNGPWFMADFEAGVWAGGSNPNDPGWGALDTNAPPNTNNPSLRVPFAIGFLKVSNNYALRMADLQTASDLTTAYEGAMPKAVDHQGAVVLGVGGDNSNNSWGTFFEGAIVRGYPDAATELAVMQNVQAAGYGQ